MGTPVTIGVPVYNGENYLERALSSLAAQTYGDLRIVISDNASSDGTEDICRRFVAEDSRFEYSRNETNVGAIPNYNKVFYAATTPYFKWAAHDDWIEPRFIEVCVAALDANPTASIAYTAARQVDENDVEVAAMIAHSDVTSPDPVARFKEVVNRERLNLPIFGLMRREMLARTHMQGTYHASARVLLAELAALGPFVRSPEVLFVHRNHPEGSLRSYGGAHDVRKWYDASRSAKGYMPRWAYMNGLMKVTEVAPLTGAQKRAIRAEALKWGATKPKALLADLVVAGKSLVTASD